MNYEAYAGYWFYGGVDAGETAGYFSSWGLLANAPEGEIHPKAMLKGHPNIPEIAFHPTMNQR